MNYSARWTAIWDATFYTSATNLSVTGNSGIVATPLVPASGFPMFIPLCFRVTGNNMATDEENTLTIDWYLNATGAGGAIGTTTFVTMTAGSPSPAVEIWPGDVTAYDVAREYVPLFPYCKLTWTLAGTTKSMGFVVYISYVTELC